MIGRFDALNHTYLHSSITHIYAAMLHLRSHIGAALHYFEP